MNNKIEHLSTQVIVIGSGAGGSVIAATLSEAGYEVLILEEGPAVDTRSVATHTPQAMRQFYRNGGLSPILGSTNIAFVEGRCVGGSTEINSAFWHRTPMEAIERWCREYAVYELSEDYLNALFQEIEAQLCVSVLNSHQPPASSAVFKRGAEKLGWAVVEVPRAQSNSLSSSQFAPGAKRSMSQTYLPRAIQAGARLLSGCRATRLHHQKGRVKCVTAVKEDNRTSILIEAEAVFVCGGAIQTPVLLRASGIKRNVGNNLHIHPMLKVAAQFEERLDSHLTVLPIYQVKEFSPDITLGGSVFTPGFLAMTLSENCVQNGDALRDWRQMGLYYVACRSLNRGFVRVFPKTQEAIMFYNLSKSDQANLNFGLARLCEVLFAGGARRIYPGLRRNIVLHSPAETKQFIESPLPCSVMSLSTVHAFSTCPMGEKVDRCATDSFGKMHGFENLYVADASLIPDSPGINPQGTVMALALRNARRFIEQKKKLWH